MLLPGGKLFWNIMIFVGCLTVVSMFFYCVPNFPRLNFPEYATEMIPPFAGNAHMFISQLTGPTACFMGIDILAVFGREAHDPTKNMPWGMFWTFVVTVVFAWWVTLTVVSSSPGVGPILVDKNLLFPMHMSFEDIYGITNGAANLLMVPMVFSTALAFLHAAGCQMQSMSKSGLLPAYLSKTHGANHVPVYGILTAALLGYIARVLRWHFAPHGHTLYSLSMVGACCVYISLFWCYLVFKVRYGAMDRRFTNPFGVWSAIYGICYFAIILLSILFVQMNYQAVLGFAPYIVLSIIYYYKVVEARQFFSKEEQATFMKAYVLNGMYHVISRNYF
jgi:L-asparagine transporter-like permease